MKKNRVSIVKEKLPRLFKLSEKTLSRLFSQRVSQFKYAETKDGGFLNTKANKWKSAGGY